MSKFRKKPVVIEAYQWNGERPLPYPLLGNWDNNPMTSNKVSIETLEGYMNVSLGDWIIKGVNGEFYPCKPDIFEKTYEMADNAGVINFGQAIEAAKKGHKIARSGWNGKGMFVVYMEPLYLPPFNSQNTMRKVNDRTAKWIGEDAPLDSQGYFAMFNAQKQWQPGWLPSQADILAEDWVILDV